MVRIGVRELRQNASEWLRRAQAGERIEVTNRGHVVAILGPPSAGGPLSALRETGRLKRATHTGPLPRPVKTQRLASAALADMRADER
jgi:antitoxin (DNA-binding transcriptional repressor) of toxin-antitoxin stability system